MNTLIAGVGKRGTMFQVFMPVIADARRPREKPPMMAWN